MFEDVHSSLQVAFDGTSIGKAPMEGYAFHCSFAERTKSKQEVVLSSFIFFDFWNI